MASKLTFIIIQIILTNKIISTKRTYDPYTMLDDDTEQERILGGTRAESKQFPYVVYIENDSIEDIPKTGWVCTGSLLTALWVLTARHCYAGYERKNIPLSQVKSIVRAGIIDRKVMTKTSQERESLYHIQHKKDSNNELPDFLNKDILILKVSRPFIINQYVKPITGLKKPFPLGYPVTCIIVGYGRTKPSNNPKEVLYNTKLHFAYAVVQENAISCRERARQSGYGYTRYWGKQHICIDPFDYKKTPCNGDSGGPLVCGGRLAGVSSGRLNSDVSVNPLCGLPGNYHEWLMRRIPNLPSFQRMLDSRMGVRGADATTLPTPPETSTTSVAVSSVATCLPSVSLLVLLGLIKSTIFR